LSGELLAHLLILVATFGELS
jgi:hypothetical protein